MRASRVFLAAFAFYLLTIPVYFLHKSSGNSRSIASLQTSTDTSPVADFLPKRLLSTQGQVREADAGRRGRGLLQVRAPESPPNRTLVLHLPRDHFE